MVTRANKWHHETTKFPNNGLYTITVPKSYTDGYLNENCIRVLSWALSSAICIRQSRDVRAEIDCKDDDDRK
jgi:hypothetical protein